MEKPIGGYHIREIENENCHPLNKNVLGFCYVPGFWMKSNYGGSIESKEERKNVNIKLLVISNLPTVS